MPLRGPSFPPNAPRAKVSSPPARSAETEMQTAQAIWALARPPPIRRDASGSFLQLQASPLPPPLEDATFVACATRARRRPSLPLDEAAAPGVAHAEIDDQRQADHRRDVPVEAASHPLVLEPERDIFG